MVASLLALPALYTDTFISIGARGHLGDAGFDDLPASDGLRTWHWPLRWNWSRWRNRIRSLLLYTGRRRDRILQRIELNTSVPPKAKQRYAERMSSLNHGLKTVNSVMTFGYRDQGHQRPGRKAQSCKIYLRLYCVFTLLQYIQTVAASAGTRGNIPPQRTGHS